MQRDGNSTFSIKVVSDQNPIRIKLPIIPRLSTGSNYKQLTIDCCTFTIAQYAAPLYIPPIGGPGGAVAIVFNNGYGVYDKDGRRTRTLQIMMPRWDILDQVGKTAVATWCIVGAPDVFQWTTGHDLQFGFIDNLQVPIDFKQWNTKYTFTLNVDVQ